MLDENYSVQMDAVAEPPRHVAIIMDGNGRWAAKRGLPRAVGHQRGVDSVRRVVKAAIEQGISFLTLFCFSSENWSRPESEIMELMSLLKRFIRQDLAELHAKDIRIRMIGASDGVDSDILHMVREAEELTKNNRGLQLVVAFNYGSRDEITRAVRVIAENVKSGNIDPKDVTPEFIDSQLDTAGIPDPDLLIRTSGESRLSNFLLWQSAYTEFVFTDLLWPDFDEAAFGEALKEYQGRHRRFGGLTEKPLP